MLKNVIHLHSSVSATVHEAVRNSFFNDGNENLLGKNPYKLSIDIGWRENQITFENFTEQIHDMPWKRSLRQFQKIVRKDLTLLYSTNDQVDDLVEVINSTNFDQLKSLLLLRTYMKVDLVNNSTYSSTTEVY